MSQQHKADVPDNHKSPRHAPQAPISDFENEQAPVFSQNGLTPGALTPQKVLQLQRTLGNKAVTGMLRSQSKTPNTVQRVVELRPPGKGEASAFERRDELVARLNAQTTALSFSLDDRKLQAEVVDEANLSNFDRQMQKFIDLGTVIPLRMITSEGMVGDKTNGFQHVFVDAADSGYFDLDDMLACDDMSFQMNMIHILTERGAIKNYDKRIGTGISDPEFQSAHRKGIDAEAEHLQSVIGDPTIKFNYEENKPGGTVVFAFKSKEGYRVIHVFANINKKVAGGKVSVILKDGKTRLTLDDFIAQRKAEEAAKAAADAPAAEEATAENQQEEATEFEPEATG